MKNRLFRTKRRSLWDRPGVYVKSAEGGLPIVPEWLSKSIEDGSAFEPGGCLAAPNPMRYPKVN